MQKAVVSVCGPVAELVFAVALLILARFTSGFLQVFLLICSEFAFMAVIHMLPFSGYDGEKIWKYSRGLWAVLFSLMSLGPVLGFFILRHAIGIIKTLT
jgi:hypothetical protein